MTARTDLQTRYRNICTEIAAIKNTDRPEYVRRLYFEKRELENELMSPAVDLAEGTSTIGPFEEESRGIT